MMSEGTPDEVLVMDYLYGKLSYNIMALELAAGGIVYDLSFPKVAYRGEPKEASIREDLTLLILMTISQQPYDFG